MKELTTNDFYLISEIADLMDIELPKAPVTKDKTEEQIEKLQSEYGQKILTLFVKKAYKAKEPINRLLASKSDKSVFEIENLSIVESGKMLMNLIKSQGFMDFFK